MIQKRLRGYEFLNHLSAFHRLNRSICCVFHNSVFSAVVVYDVTSQDSFERAQRWISELRDQASKDIVIALAGNKVDLCQDTESFEHN